MKNILLAISIIISSFFLSSCGSKDNSLKPTPLTKYKPQAEIKQNWSSSVGKGSGNSVYNIGTGYVNNSIITASIDGKLKAIAINKNNYDNGATIWQTNNQIYFTSSPLVINNSIYIGSYKGYISSFNQNNGKLNWKTQLSSSIFTKPAYVNETVFVKTHDNNLFALNAKTGKIIWHIDHKTPSIILTGDSSPAVTNDDDILFADDNGILTLLNNENGKIIWSRPIATPKGADDVSRMVDINSTPLVDEDSVYVMTYQGKVIAIDISENKLLWQKDMSGFRNMAQDDTNLYIADATSKVVAIDKSNGKTIWAQKNLIGRKLSSPAILNDKYLLLGDYNGYVHILDIENGSLLGRYHLTKSAINTAALIVNKNAIVNTVNGNIFSLSISPMLSIKK